MCFWVEFLIQSCINLDSFLYSAMNIPKPQRSPESSKSGVKLGQEQLRNCVSQLQEHEGIKKMIGPVRTGKVHKDSLSALVKTDFPKLSPAAIEQIVGALLDSRLLDLSQVAEVATRVRDALPGFVPMQNGVRDLDDNEIEVMTPSSSTHDVLRAILGAQYDDFKKEERIFGQAVHHALPPLLECFINKPLEKIDVQKLFTEAQKLIEAVKKFITFTKTIQMDPQDFDAYIRREDRLQLFCFYDLCMQLWHWVAKAQVSIEQIQDALRKAHDTENLRELEVKDGVLMKVVKPSSPPAVSPAPKPPKAQISARRKRL